MQVKYPYRTKRTFIRGCSLSLSLYMYVSNLRGDKEGKPSKATSRPTYRTTYRTIRHQYRTGAA